MAVQSIYLSTKGILTFIVKNVPCLGMLRAKARWKGGDELAFGSVYH